MADQEKSRTGDQRCLSWRVGSRPICQWSEGFQYIDMAPAEYGMGQLLFRIREYQGEEEFPGESQSVMRQCHMLVQGLGIVRGQEAGSQLLRFRRGTFSLSLQWRWLAQAWDRKQAFWILKLECTWGAMREEEGSNPDTDLTSLWKDKPDH